MRHRDVEVQHRIRKPHGRWKTSSRRGFLTPAVAVALVAVLICLALVLDRWWLDNASAELTTAAESAALAGARELVSDDLLRDSNRVADLGRIDPARQAAIRIAAQNNVAGQPLQLTDRDVLFGTLTGNAGSVRFNETTTRPTTIVITARRTRANGNPVAMLLRGGNAPADVNITRRVEATVDNHVIGVRPFAGVSVPMLPLAISEADTVTNSGETLPGWQTQIDQRNGRDDYAFDLATKSVVQRADGIPEITLRCGNGITAMPGANLLLIDIGSGLQIAKLEQQLTGGINTADLSATNGMLRFDAGPQSATGFAAMPSTLQQRLSQQIGQCRIVLLTSQIAPPDAAGKSQLQCHRLVAGRVMAVRTTTSGECEIVFQPGTIVTRTAVLADRNLPVEQRRSFANPSIYKLQLTQ